MTAMAMLFLLASMAASFADRAVPAATWRRWFRQALGSEEHYGSQPAVSHVHAVFSGLFDYVYGPSTWSTRRIVSSLVSSLAGLAIVVVALGPSETVFASVGALVQLRNISQETATAIASQIAALVLVAICLVPLNLVADFFSLAETRLILRYGRNRGPWGILGITIIDLVLTATLYLLPIAAVGFYFFGDVESVRDLIAMMFRREIGWPFFLTTFVTSFAWILFVSCALLIRGMNLWPLTKRIADEMIQSDRPFASVTALAYVVIAALWWPASVGIAAVAGERLPTSIDGGLASPIELDRTYHGHFANENESHRLSFVAMRDVTYVIETEPTFFVDTKLELRSNDEEIAAEDICGPNVGSKVELAGETNRTYVIEIRQKGELTLVGTLSAFDFGVREKSKVGEPECSGLTLEP